MFKKIVKKLRKKNSKYSTFNDYNINYHNFEVGSCFGSKNTDRKIYLNKNQVKQLSNDFYSELYSLNNLPIYYLFLMVIIVPLVSMVAIYFVFNTVQTDSNHIVPFILAVISSLIFNSCRKKNEDLIIERQSRIYNRKFVTIDEVRFFWLKEKIGWKSDFYEFAKKLSEWRQLKEKYNQRSRIDWLNYIYDPQSKPRILALFIALVSLCTIIIINTFEIDPFTVLVAFFGFKHVLTELTLLIVFLVFLICFLSWQLIFLGYIFSRAILYLTDFLNKNNFSEIKFSVLINFLLDHSDFYE